MAQRSDQSKGQSTKFSPSRSLSTSRKLSISSSINSKVDHPSPKSPSETQTILFPEIHQHSPEVQSLIENLEKVSILLKILKLQSYRILVFHPLYNLEEY